MRRGLNGIVTSRNNCILTRIVTPWQRRPSSACSQRWRLSRLVSLLSTPHKVSTGTLSVLLQALTSSSDPTHFSEMTKQLLHVKDCNFIKQAMIRKQIFVDDV